MKMKYAIIALTLVCISLAGCRNRTSDKAGKADSDIPEVVDTDSLVRAEGSATSSNVEMATEMARINAMTVLAEKLAGVDSTVTVAADGSTTVTTEVETPLYDVVLVDKRIYTNKDGSFTVWVLLETKKTNNL